VVGNGSPGGEAADLPCLVFRTGGEALKAPAIPPIIAQNRTNALRVSLSLQSDTHALPASPQHETVA
jgi:hypothetical protein